MIVIRFSGKNEVIQGRKSLPRTIFLLNLVDFLVTA